MPISARGPFHPQILRRSLVYKPADAKIELLLPSNRRTGWTGTVGLSWQEEAVGIDLLMATRTVERYIPQIDNTEEKGTSDDKRGYEIAVFETLEMRRGTFDDDDGAVHLDTEGFTVKSDGIFKLMTVYQKKTDEKNSHWLSIAEHVSISWTKFEYRGSEGVFGKLNHAQVTVKF